MAGTLRVRRSKGALSGFVLILLGIWGALIPFVGPYFHYAYTPLDGAWKITSGRMWLEVLPGVVALAGGVIVLTSRLRPVAMLGAWLAAVAGAWFAVGGLVAARFPSLPAPGRPAGTGTRLLVEQLGFFTGIGVVVVFVAALALGRFTVIAARDADLAAEEDLEPEFEPDREREPVGAGAGRGFARITPVPVFRGRRREAD